MGSEQRRLKDLYCKGQMWRETEWHVCVHPGMVYPRHRGRKWWSRSWGKDWSCAFLVRGCGEMLP